MEKLLKLKNYEKKSFIIFISILFIVSLIAFIILLFTKKEYHYNKMSGIVLDKDLVILVVDDKERKNIYNNTFLYLNSKKERYKIIEDKGIILKKEKMNYHEILVKINFDKDYKINDTINLSIKTKKIRLIEIFKIIWEGG